MGKNRGDEPSSDASVSASPAADRIAHLEAALLHIAETDRHYRTPPKPHADGGLRGWAGHHAVWALTGLNGSYTGDAEVRAALAAGQSLTGQAQDGSSQKNGGSPTDCQTSGGE